MRTHTQIQHNQAAAAYSAHWIGERGVRNAAPRWWCGGGGARGGGRGSSGARLEGTHLQPHAGHGHAVHGELGGDVPNSIRTTLYHTPSGGKGGKGGKGGGDQKTHPKMRNVHGCVAGVHAMGVA
jgi:hypothetical protein